MKIEGFEKELAELVFRQYQDVVASIETLTAQKRKLKAAARNLGVALPQDQKTQEEPNEV